jgi:hypothetical protein
MFFQMIQIGINEFIKGVQIYLGGGCKSLGTNGTSELLNGHFRLAANAGGVFKNMEADSGGSFEYGGRFRRQI